ncbi:Chromosome partition protein smc, partial [hydrothermal vent metagenome]
TDGDALQPGLIPGQRLVSLSGDLWRWDGYIARAGAPTAASRRLKARNRLTEIRQSLEEASVHKDQTAAAFLQNKAAREAAEAAEHQARSLWRKAGKAADQARASRDAHERATREAREKRIALEEARGRINRDLEDAQTALATARTASAGQPDQNASQADLDPLRACVVEERRALGQAEARAGALAREAEIQAARLTRIGTETDRWQTRAKAASAQRQTLLTRQTEIKSALAELSRLPAQIAEKRSALADTIATAERQRQAAADTLATAEARLAEQQKSARALQASLAETREALARAEARQEAATERHAAAAAAISEALGMQPEGALTVAGFAPGDDLPDAAKTEAGLARMKSDRDRLGAVNLRAEEEAAEQGTRLETMKSERQDLEQAIGRLRQGIASLNTKARQRLLAAFENVNTHFRDLFRQLFGGGTAELTLTEADDLLDAGLEIVARPPGKKPQVLTLLSGGEQALTAIALILAVFRTNPSPVCVLDEVDAPLDDANVERFCNVIQTLAHQTDTRFLIITHHAYTMAQMDRLFGVTMAENGVSQLVSVDLDTAHSYREAG